MQLTVIVPVSRRRGFDEFLSELPRALDRLDVSWEVRFRSARSLPAELRTRLGSIDPRFQIDAGPPRGAVIVSCTGYLSDLSQIEPMLDALERHSADAVLPYVANLGPARGLRSWRDRLDPRLFSIALRHRVRMGRVAPRAFRRELLDSDQLDNLEETDVIARAFATGRSVLQVPVLPSLKAPDRPRSRVLAAIGLVARRRPLLFLALAGALVFVVAAMDGSKAGLEWLTSPDEGFGDSPIGMGCLALVGAQAALFAYIWDRHHGLRLARVGRGVDSPAQ